MQPDIPRETCGIWKTRDLSFTNADDAVLLIIVYALHAQETTKRPFMSDF